jgi:RimJ/RimL family protein N-acetyltransferase
MHAYRSDPEVCRYLSHAPLDRDGVRRRIEARTGAADPASDRLTRGLTVELDDRVVGDAMLRVQRDTDSESLWIGYAFAREAWGQGLATEVAGALVDVGRELGLPIWADYVHGNEGSGRVLAKLGFVDVGDEPWNGQLLRLVHLPD